MCFLWKLSNSIIKTIFSFSITLDFSHFETMTNRNHYFVWETTSIWLFAVFETITDTKNDSRPKSGIVCLSEHGIPHGLIEAFRSIAVNMRNAMNIILPCLVYCMWMLNSNSTTHWNFIFHLHWTTLLKTTKLKLSDA